MRKNTINGFSRIFIFLLTLGLVSCYRNEIDDLQSQIDDLKVTESYIENLLDRIQSVAVVPQDTDGSVTVGSDGNCTICFDVKPTEVAEELSKAWTALPSEKKESLMSFKIKGFSSQDTEVPLATITSVSFEDDELKVSAMFSNLPGRSVASLQIGYEDSDVASEYFSIFLSSEKKHYVTPTGISVISINPVCLTAGTKASIEFRVNPSNATFVMSGDDCQLALDKCGQAQTKSSYVTTPSNYRLSKVEYVFDEETEELKVGQYRAIIEDTGEAADYDEMAAFVLNVTDANGDYVQISSSAFEVVGKSFDYLSGTGLPIVVINTPNCEPIVSKDVWLDGSVMTIMDSDRNILYNGSLGIRGRGNTTWEEFPKKPYALKLDSKSEILGMPKNKRWCLIANWMDRTMIRNAVSYEIARKCPSLGWTPSGKFVELVLNGKHMGNFYLCEQVKVDKNRVDMEDGFIMELDSHFDEANKFMSEKMNLPWMFKDPDEVTDDQFSYMQNFVNDMEDALCDETRFASREFTKYMDLDSFIDYWFVYELTMNWEPNHPKSCYVHKDKDDVLKAGPVWDFDWGTFSPDSTDYFMIDKSLYYGRLLQDPVYKARTKEKWMSEKAQFKEVTTYIDSLSSQLAASDELNHPMWPITLLVNGDVDLPYEEAVERLKTAYLAKLSWMDVHISGW